MILVDTHTHLYLDAFDADRETVVNRALEAGVKYILLPNIDAASVDSLHRMAEGFPGICLPMMGLHPTSVGENWEAELQIISDLLEEERYAGLGEIGIDLYWDTTYREAQIAAFRHQIRLAHRHGLAVSVHSRDAMDLILDELEEMALPGLRGILHCFTGDSRQANRAVNLGFKLGIGGVLTFRKSGLAEVVQDVGLDHLVLETDAPFLAPVPYRGKRNESAYILLIAEALAEVLHTSLDEVAEVTTRNAIHTFNIDTYLNRI